MVAPHSIQLPVLADGNVRPSYAQGPRDLASLRMLRLSVTDRCNLRCAYCMPEEGVEFEDRKLHLSPAEFEAVARVAAGIGVRHFKLTGGEPTIRRDILEIVERLAALGGEDLSMTTNGLKLVRMGDALRMAGLDRVTVSLDSLQPGRYRSITGGGRLDLALAGLDHATRVFDHVKVNVVVMRGVNDDEVAAFAALTLTQPWTIRFIEYMPLGDSAICRASPLETMVSMEETVSRIAAVHGPLQTVDRSDEVGVGPADVFKLDGAIGRVGFIHAMSSPFCATCNRLRLTARGELRSCLFDGGEVPLIDLLRPRPDVAALERAFAACVVLKPDVHSARGDRAMSQIGG